MSHRSCWILKKVSNDSLNPSIFVIGKSILKPRVLLHLMLYIPEVTSGLPFPMRSNSVSKLVDTRSHVIEERIATSLVSNFSHAENHGAVNISNLFCFISILQLAIHLRNRLWLNNETPERQARPLPVAIFLFFSNKST